MTRRWSAVTGRRSARPMTASFVLIWRSLPTNVSSSLGDASMGIRWRWVNAMGYAMPRRAAAVEFVRAVTESPMSTIDASEEAALAALNEELAELDLEGHWRLAGAVLAE